VQHRTDQDGRVPDPFEAADDALFGAAEQSRCDRLRFSPTPFELELDVGHAAGRRGVLTGVGVDPLEIHWLAEDLRHLGGGDQLAGRCAA
jgi:hypothetical protein